MVIRIVGRNPHLENLIVEKAGVVHALYIELSSVKEGDVGTNKEVFFSDPCHGSITGPGRRRTEAPVR